MMLFFIIVSNVKGWSVFKRTFSTGIFAAVLFFYPFTLLAAGLGKLTVQSGLGQPLRGEIELLSVTKEEAGSLSARLASAEAFQQAGITYSSELAAIKLAVENNSRGEPVVKLSTAQPFDEPFLDLLVELTWSSGRLVREYTALLDPPDVGIPLPPSVAVAPEAAPQSKSTSQPQAAATPASPSGDGESASPSGDGEYGPVKSGETLSKIAKEVKPGDASLEQALVSLYRANQDAFSGNMNRLKTGVILRVPDTVEFASVTKSEATAEVVAQLGNWNSYRQKLGLAPVAVAAAGSQQSASGKISVAAPEDDAKDQDVLRISQAETVAATAQASGGLQQKIKSLEEEVIAREQAVKEANERVAMLEEQVREMKRLVELQGQTTAPVVQDKAEATAPSPAGETGTAQPEAKPAPANVAAPALPEASTSPLDEILANPLYLAGIALIVVLAGWLGFRAFRGSQTEPRTLIDEPAEPTIATDYAEAVPAYAEAAPAPAAAAESISTTAPAAAEDMDPLAEAEVYLAYDREFQAEEILKEGLKKTPARHELHMKLLEIYAGRRDFTSFDVVARQLHNSSGGMGQLWERAAQMGFALNPSNPLYARETPVDLSPVTVAADEPVFAAPEEATATLPEFAYEPSREAPETVLAASESEFSSDETLILHAESTAEETFAKEEDEFTPEKLIATIDFNAERNRLAATETDVKFESPVARADDKPAFDFAMREEPESKSDELPVSGGNGHAGDYSFDSEPRRHDLSDIDLNLEDQPAPSAQDEVWQQVETKFDLARAYREMGENEGAREILEEVIKDGDAKQQRAARSMLANL